MPLALDPDRNTIHTLLMTNAERTYLAKNFPHLADYARERPAEYHRNLDSKIAEVVRLIGVFIEWDTYEGSNEYAGPAPYFVDPGAESPDLSDIDVQDLMASYAERKLRLIRSHSRLIEGAVQRAERTIVIGHLAGVL